MKRTLLFSLMTLTLTFGISSCTTVKQKNSNTQEDRIALGAKAFPGQREFLYIDIPSANNGLSNLIGRAFISETLATKQLIGAIARGANEPTYVIVGSRDNGVAYSTAKAALNSFSGKQLPYLHLGLIGDQDEAEQLRSTVDALGAEYRVLPSS